MRIDVSIENRVLQDKLALLARRARVTQGQVLREEARIITQNLMRVTPPATYAQGRKAVTRDLGKVYTSVGAVMKRMNSVSFTGKEQWQVALVKASKRNDENAIRELLTRPISGVETVTVRPHQRGGQQVSGYTAQRPFNGPSLPEISGGTQIGGSLNPQLHRSRRDRRGHVRGKILSQVVTKNKTLNDYRKEVLSRVGWHMAGWVPLARLTGAKVPAWVAKTRLAAASGTATANFTGGARAFVLATNFDVKIPNYQSVVNSVVAARIRVTAQKIERLMRGHAVNLGFTRIAAR
jgi:hypothetical protein